LVLVHPERRRLVFIECKSETGIITPEQTAWHDDLAKCDEEVYLVRPAQLSEIAGILMLGHKPNIGERVTYESAVVCLTKGDSLR
jgi:hypothetical protein